MTSDPDLSLGRRDEGMKGPRVGLVIGSGGLKAAAAIALLEFLEEAEIDVDLIVSCSGGSIIAGLLLASPRPPSLREHLKNGWTRELFAKIDYRTLLSIAGLPFGRFDKNRGLIKSDTVKKTYNTFYGDAMLEECSPRTLMQATDVLTGEPVLLSSGLVRDTVYASAALFPILPPLEIEGRWLMDGAYSSPLPVLEAIRESMDVIITMSFEERTEAESRGFVPYFMRAVGYSSLWLTRSQVALSVDMHHYELIFINVVFDKFIGLRSVHRIPEILEAGEKAVAAKKDAILAAIEGFSP
jgi:NTE family protein